MRQTCKRFRRGFYGGKFLPFHKGHRYCIAVAAAECESLVVILFSDSEEEREILREQHAVSAELLDEASRIRAIREECARYPDVRLEILDCREMHRQAILDGMDTWDAETEYVMAAVGEFQAVYSSEPGYDAYFRRAYPFAEHRLVDPPRVHVPISGTAIRAMDDEEAVKWL